MQYVGALHIIVRNNDDWKKLHTSNILDKDELESLGLDILPFDTTECFDCGDYLYFAYHGLEYIVGKIMRVFNNDCIIVLTSADLNTDDNVEYACYFGDNIRYNYLDYEFWNKVPSKYVKENDCNLFHVALPEELNDWYKKVKIRLTKKEKEFLKSFGILL